MSLKESGTNMKKLGIILTIVVACLAVTACNNGGGTAGSSVVSQTSTGQGGIVSGTLTGEGSLANIPVFLIAEDQTPVLSANSSIHADIAGSYYSTTTDDEGKFIFSDVTEGNYNVVAQQSRFLSAIQRDITVVRANTIALTLKLTATGDIAGKVVLPQGSDPLGVVAFVAGTSYAAFADTAGQYKIAGIPIGTYTLSFSGKGFAVQSVASVTVSAGKTTSVADVTLQFGGSFNVVVSGSERLKGGMQATYEAKVFGTAVGPFTYAWTATAGTFLVTNAQKVGWTAPTPTTGMVNVECTITDSVGAFAKGTLGIEVLTAANQTPELKIQGPTVVNIGSAAHFIALGNDPENEVITYQWLTNSGTYASPTSRETDWTAPGTTGPQNIQCKATDASGNTVTTTITVTVQDYTVAPTNLAKSVTFGGNGIDMASALDRNANGDLFVTGYTYSTDWPDTRTASYGDRDVFVMKLDANATPIWAVRFGGISLEDPNAVRAMPDGGCVVAGSTDCGVSGDFTTNSNGGRDAFVARFASDGKVLWVKRLGTSYLDEAVSVLVTSQGSVVVLWYEDVSGVNHFNLSRLDQNGNLEASLADIISSGGYWSGAVVPAADGNYWVAANNGVQISLNKVSASFTSSSGILGTRSFSPSTGSTPAPWDVAGTPDGGALIVGSTDSKTTARNWIAIKAGPISTTYEWREVVGDSGVDDIAVSVKVPSDGRYIIGGYGVAATGGKGAGDGWIRCYNTSGGLLWQSIWGGSAEDRIFEIALNGDNGYYFAGYADSTDKDLATRSTGGSDVWIGKVTY